MKIRYSFIVIFLTLSIGSLYSQVKTMVICNSFDSNILHIVIDSTGIWEIGKPSKPVFNDSYTGNNSIVTGLDTLYPKNDTSVFEAYFTSPFGIPNYLGLYLPLQIEFDHRFKMDSVGDFGKIEMSMDKGTTWYDVLSNDLNTQMTHQGIINYHYFESSGDTLFDSLSVQGNSNGWVHSKIWKDVGDVIFNGTVYSDSIIFRFTFISDSNGVDEGWQIDNLCISMDYLTSVNELKSENELNVFPNPNNGTFQLENKLFNNGVVEVCDLTGRIVFTNNVERIGMVTINTLLKPGLYLVKLGNGEKAQFSKMIVR